MAGKVEILAQLKFEFSEFGSTIVFEQKIITKSQFRKYNEWMTISPYNEIEFWASDPPREYCDIKKVKEIQLSIIDDKEIIKNWKKMKDGGMVTENMNIFETLDKYIDE
jgi:hypothetical protein